MTATTLRALLDASVAYTAAARAHHEASFYDDEEAMDQANIDAQEAYKDLVKAQADALLALDGQEPDGPARCPLCDSIGGHALECPSAGAT